MEMLEIVCLVIINTLFRIKFVLGYRHYMNMPPYSWHNFFLRMGSPAGNIRTLAKYSVKYYVYGIPADYLTNE